jgi:hypothetical protein
MFMKVLHMLENDDGFIIKFTFITLLQDVGLVERMLFVYLSILEP